MIFDIFYGMSWKDLKNLLISFSPSALFKKKNWGCIHFKIKVIKTQEISCYKKIWSRFFKIGIISPIQHLDFHPFKRLSWRLIHKKIFVLKKWIERATSKEILWGDFEKFQTNQLSNFAQDIFLNNYQINLDHCRP